MNVRVITCGKIKEKWLEAGIQEYSKRIKPYLKLEIIEVKDVSDAIPEGRAKAEEGEKLLAQIRSGYNVALDLAGEELDSVQLADKLGKWLELGGAQVNFLIAGSRGFSEEVLARCDARFSMSRLTFPHQLARLIFLEQLYRACKIRAGEKYHK